MPKPISIEDFQFRLHSTMETDSPAKPDPETPFRIAVLGDFSGRASRGILDFDGSRPLLADRDNIDDLIARLKVEVHVSLNGDKNPLVITFKELDDFHPDNIFNKLEIFRSLRKLRKELKDPSTFEAASREIKGWHVDPDSPAGPAPESKAESKVTERQTPPFGNDNLLDQVLDVSADQNSADFLDEGGQDPGLSAFLRKIVAPHLVPDDNPKQQKCLELVDTAITRVMQAILHHPQFQQLESVWRGLDFLVRRLETGADLEVYLVDVSKEELGADLLNSSDLRSTALYRIFVEQAVDTYGGQPWAVLAGCYTFEKDLRDAVILGGIAGIAAKAGAPFIAGADPSVVDFVIPVTEEVREAHDADDSMAWKMLRESAAAAYLGLALPGFLLRLPYGENTDPVEYFDLEEFPAESGHSGYLWGPASVFCACLLGQAFSRDGWQMRPGSIQDLGRLPLHIYKEEGETRVKPCAEVLMTERTAATLLEKGVMPLLSFKDQDTVRLGRFQSIAQPPTRLKGRWE